MRYPLISPRRWAILCFHFPVQFSTSEAQRTRTCKFNDSISMLGEAFYDRHSSQRHLSWSLNNLERRSIKSQWTISLSFICSQNQYCLMKTRDQSAVNERDLKSNKTIKFSSLVANDIGLNWTTGQCYSVASSSTFYHPQSILSGLKSALQ